jgi:hypothetical protein
VRFILCALILAALVGPGQAASALPPAAAAKKTIPNPTDGQILAVIRAKLVKSKVSTDRFTVTVQNGIATFEGKTSVVQHKGVATRIARSSGAVAVQNHIQISDEAKARAVAKLKGSDTVSATPAVGRNAASQPPPLARATVLPPGK